MAGGAIILIGVALAVAPSDAIDRPRRVIAWGVFWGLVAAFGQGYGAVMSRKAYDLGTPYGFDIDGGFKHPFGHRPRRSRQVASGVT